ncbi:hypothetical protein WG78_08755 [Amantichitinum ursilacus]|uniref:Uncharacterized protein n=1 Tax=Amantichitinum ursilacus TaxID=857265 RepID=A0A0N0XLB0_9NEIS|nr:hypothetical protein WG78_08755 [Amantichitinum ursilacus]
MHYWTVRGQLQQIHDFRCMGPYFEDPDEHYLDNISFSEVDPDCLNYSCSGQTRFANVKVEKRVTG